MSGDRKKKRRIKYQLLDEPPTGVSFVALDCSALAPGASPPGSTTQFIDKGAQKLTNIHLMLIFWGIQWAGNPTLAAEVEGTVKNLLAGPYMSYLAQYGVRRASIYGTTKVVDSDPPDPFATSDIGNFIINEIDNDTLPEPDRDWPIVYAVFMPSNVSFVDPQVGGANSRIMWRDYDLGDSDKDPAYYFWVGQGEWIDQPGAPVDYITTALSHELVEICTDPNGGDGIVQIGGKQHLSQVGDVCTTWCDYVRGVKVQSYWVHNLGDPRNGKCVLPKYYSVRRTLAGRNFGGRLRSIQDPIPSLNSLIASLF